jgi:hypothetical protein
MRRSRTTSNKQDTRKQGADPNGNAGDDDEWDWISAAGERPRPLHCVAIAWEHKPAHVEIVKLLRAKGAIVDETVLQDYWIETTLTEDAIAVGAALGEDEADLRALQQEHGAVEDRYADGKVLFIKDED